MHNAVSQVEGMVTNDGKVLRVTEIGGTFKGAQIQGYMPDTGHMVGLQVFVCLSGLTQFRVSCTSDRAHLAL
jgi:hypothetical protein